MGKMMTCEEYLYFYPSVDKVKLAKYGTWYGRKLALAKAGEVAAKYGQELVSAEKLTRQEKARAKVKLKVGKYWYYAIKRNENDSKPDSLI